MGNQKESKGAAEKTGKHKNARAFIECADFGNHGISQTALEGRGCGFNQPQQTACHTNAEQFQMLSWGHKSPLLFKILTV